MRKTFYILGAILILFSSCKKANEDDQSLYTDSIIGAKIRYIVMVTDGSTNISKTETLITDAVVSLVVNDSIYKIQVDETGMAVFNNLFSGNAAVKVTCDGYTSLNYIVDLKAVNDSLVIYDATNRRVVSSIVPLFPLTGDGTAEISGKLFADLDLTDGDLETVTEDLPIRAIVNPSELTDYIDHPDSGGILDLSYEGLSITTDNESGDYSITVPASANGLTYIITSDDFDFLQQITPTETSRKIFRLSPDTVKVQSGGSYIWDLYYDF